MDINSKDLASLQLIDKEFGQSTPYFWSTYILPNGHFLNPENHSNSEYWDDIYTLNYEHEGFENWAFNYIGKEYYHLFSDYCMKMNTTYPYIMLPEQRWTPEQINAFRKIVDGRDFEYAWEDIQSHIDYNGGKHDVSSMEEPLMIESSNDDFVVAYDLAYTSADDIIKDINRYYSTGVMITERVEESKKKKKKKDNYNLRVVNGDVAADIASFTAMSCVGGPIGEGYKQPETFFKLTDDEAVWTDEGEDWHYWSSEADDWEENYAKAYKCKMSPKDFLDLTTSKGADSLKLGDDIWGELKELDVDKFVKQSQPIYLDIWFDDDNNNHKAKVVGHEGRHRMFALMIKGIKKVDVVLFVREYNTSYDRYHPFDIDWVILTGQFNKSVHKTVEPITPMSWKKHQEIRPNVRELKNYAKF